MPPAYCLSTIGTDNFPNARFVSLKEVVHNKFVVTGPLFSRKGTEIRKVNKVALTFWWTETERQVRVQGTATPIDDEHADRYFSERNRESQIVSIVSHQGHELDDVNTLYQKYLEVEKSSTNQVLERPANSGGYFIEPVRIEFLEFKPTRFHRRQLFQLKNGGWTVTELQP